MIHSRQKTVFGSAALVAGLFMVVSQPAQAAATDAQKCAAAKMQVAGKYAACRLKADAKAETGATTADYQKCNESQASGWSKAEEKYGAACPVDGDATGIQTMVMANTDALVAAITAATPRFTENGDGTVTDNETGLTWETKDSGDSIADYDNLHDVDNVYQWEPLGTHPIATWINAVNASTLGGHADWRVPTKEELVTILRSRYEAKFYYAPYVCTAPSLPCVASVFNNGVDSRTANGSYVTSSQYYGNVGSYHRFDFGSLSTDDFESFAVDHHVRAVRGTLILR